MSRVVPDTIRCWIVAMACFFIFVLTFGITEASGLLYVATMPRFNVNREEASLPFTLVYCTRGAIGPVCGYLGHIFGIRTVTLIGCILAPISVGVCFFADDIISFIILWGLVFGAAFGISTSLVYAIVNEHFIKHRVKANGLVVAGASIGTLTLSPLMENLIENYGFSGALLIMSGLMLNIIPAMMVILLNKPVKQSDENVGSQMNKLPENASQKILSHQDTRNELVQCDDLCEKRNSENAVTILNSSAVIDVTELKNTQENSDGHQTTSVDSVPKSFVENLMPTPPTMHMQSVKVQDADVLENGDRSENKNISTNIPPKSNSGANDGDFKTLHGSSTSSINQSPDKWKLLRLFCNPTYVFLVIGSGVYFFSITAFLTIIVDYAMDIGISLHISAYILMWVATSDLIGYVCLCLIFEHGYISRSNFAAISYICMCLTSIAIVWSNSYIMLFIFITFFEFGQGGVIILSAPLVAEFIDDELQAPAIASLNILSAPITMTISPLIGYFRDERGSYAGVFYVISALTLLSCLLFLCIPKLERWRNNKKPAT